MAKNTVVLHLDWEVFLSRWADAELGQWARAIFSYMRNGGPPTDMSKSVEVAYYATMERIGRDLAKYETRRDAGHKGGMESGKSRNEAKRSKTQQSEVNVKQNEPTCSPVVLSPVSCNPVSWSSSKDDSIEPAGAGTTTTVPFEDFRNDFGQENGFLKGAITDIAQEVGEPLLLKVLQTCREAGGNSWGYVFKALQECKAKGTTLEEYEQAHRRGYRSTVVDRLEPSGHDILQRGRKPLKLKRED